MKILKTKSNLIWQIFFLLMLIVKVVIIFIAPNAEIELPQNTYYSAFIIFIISEYVLQRKISRVFLSAGTNLYNTYMGVKKSNRVMAETLNKSDLDVLESICLSHETKYEDITFNTKLLKKIASNLLIPTMILFFCKNGMFRMAMFVEFLQVCFLFSCFYLLNRASNRELNRIEKLLGKH